MAGRARGRGGEAESGLRNRRRRWRWRRPGQRLRQRVLFVVVPEAATATGHSGIIPQTAATTAAAATAATGSVPEAGGERGWCSGMLFDTRFIFNMIIWGNQYRAGL